ncbi:hypothetical protein [Nocardioides sp. cx-173]|uniref:hypothetical protein n=1 Tax=Nocardioides sp. cx-173 TaxID=2898796 RepID=UPI001E343729|nr:hypothetical protein [Nocardioides sp. cx-173]MCD4523978.1 hypothetical protein [Nocardioides sp. cx-173]UGB41381.1 hypothetical protein LQ940_18675 [Nocardioides sp. cx-173]
MTWPATCRRLFAAIGALLAAVLVVATTATRTAAGWSDGAAFTAQATSGTWETGGGDKCEVLSNFTGEVIGTCNVDGVTFSDAWNQGTRFSVAISGFQPSNDRVARVSVDLSKYSSAWNWPIGTVQMDSARSVDWSAPVLTFTTYPSGFSPFGGTYFEPMTASHRDGDGPSGTEQPGRDQPGREQSGSVSSS